MTRFRACLLVAVLALALGACGGGSSGSDGGTATTVSNTGPTAVVALKELKFNPGLVTVSAGDTVEWKWEENVLHNVTGDGFKSDNKSDGTFTHTFAKAGTYDYQCTLHAGMKGSVEVK